MSENARGAALDRALRALLRDQPVPGHGLQPVSPPAGLSPRSRGERRPDRPDLEPHGPGRGGVPAARSAEPWTATAGAPVDPSRAERSTRGARRCYLARRRDRAAALRGARVARRRGGAPLLCAVRVRRGPRAGGAAHGGARVVRRVGDAAHLDRRLAGDWLLPLHGFSLLFALATALAAELVRALARDARGAARPRGRAARPVGTKAALRQRELGPLWMLGTVFSIVLTAFFVFIKRFVDETGIGSVGSFFGAYTGAALTLRIFFGWLPDRVGQKRVLGPALRGAHARLRRDGRRRDGARAAARGCAVRHRPRLHVPDPVRARGQPNARGEPRLDARVLHGAVRPRRADRRAELRLRDRALRLRDDVRRRRRRCSGSGRSPSSSSTPPWRGAGGPREARAPARSARARVRQPRAPERAWRARPYVWASEGRVSSCSAAAGRSRSDRRGARPGVRRPRRRTASTRRCAPGRRAARPALCRAAGGGVDPRDASSTRRCREADGTRGTGRTVADCRLDARCARRAGGGERRDRARTPPDWRGREPALDAEERAGALVHELGHALGVTGHARSRTIRSCRVARSRAARRRARAGRRGAREPVRWRALYALARARSSRAARRRCVAHARAGPPGARSRARTSSTGRTSAPASEVGRIFWRDARGREWGFLVAGLAELARDPTQLLLLPEANTRGALPRR